jgi:hypothetical protein
MPVESDVMRPMPLDRDRQLHTTDGLLEAVRGGSHSGAAPAPVAKRLARLNGASGWLHKSDPREARRNGT